MDFAIPVGDATALVTLLAKATPILVLAFGAAILLQRATAGAVFFAHVGVVESCASAERGRNKASSSSAPARFALEYTEHVAPRRSIGVSENRLVSESRRNVASLLG